MVAIRTFSPEGQLDWDRFVASSRSGHFMFMRDYMDYHSDRFADMSLEVYDGKRLVALLPANRDGATLVSHGGLTFGGFVTGDRMSARLMLETFESLRDFLGREGIERLIYKAVPHIYYAIPAEEDLYALVRSGARLHRRDLSSSIDLTARLPYSKGRKSSLKQASSSGVAVRRSDHFEEFMGIEAQTLERHGAVSVHTGAELQPLAERFPDNIKLTCAFVDDQAIAGVVIYETGRVAHCQYIGATDQGRESGAVDLILDGLITEYADSGKRWFDFGISTEDGGRDLNVGLVRNKESYGARAIAYDHYVLEL